MKKFLSIFASSIIVFGCLPVQAMMRIGEKPNQEPTGTQRRMVRIPEHMDRPEPDMLESESVNLTNEGRTIDEDIDSLEKQLAEKRREQKQVELKKKIAEEEEKKAEERRKRDIDTFIRAIREQVEQEDERKLTEELLIEKFRIQKYVMEVLDRRLQEISDQNKAILELLSKIDRAQLKVGERYYPQESLVDIGSRYSEVSKKIVPVQGTAITYVKK